MVTVAERTMGATEFKAKCLDVMDRLSRGEWTRVIVTKRGKPVMVAEAPTPVDPMAVFGWLKGTVHIPDGLDLTQPFTDPDDWSALRDDAEPPCC